MTGLEALNGLIKDLQQGNGVSIICKEQVEKSLKALEIITPYLKLFGNCLQARTPFADTDYPWSFVKEITDEEELNLLKEVLE